jgi:hypothetical protein
MNAQPTNLLLSPYAMYSREFTGAGALKHSRYCHGFFGRRDLRCARCLELLHGSAPRGSGHESTKARMLDQLQRRFSW